MAFAAPLLAGALSAGGAVAAGGSAATALAVGSSVTTAVSGFQASQYQAQVAKNNAKIAQQNAENASLAGQQEQARGDREYAQLQGEQIAAQSASGLNLMGRTSTGLRATTATVGREQARDTYLQGSYNSQKFLQEKQQQLSNAKLLQGQSWSQLYGGLMKAGSLLGDSKSTG